MDINTVIGAAVFILGALTAFAGGLLLVKSVVAIRYQINRSLNSDLEMVRLTKPLQKTEGPSDPNAWREEIGAMEQFLGSLSTIRNQLPFFQRFFYQSPTIVFEIANPSSSEEIFFYMAVPKRFRESIEKQLSSYFPDSSIEKVKDYTIFFPGSHTVGAVLKQTKSYALPVKTYESLDVDPLSAISNSLSKLETEKEGAVIQMVLAPAGQHWRTLSRSIAHKMQQGKQLKDVHHGSMMGRVAGEMGKGLASAATGAMGPKKQSHEQKAPIQLTPEEQELIKSIERKASKPAFQANVRLIASAETPERAEQILGQLENAFSQFDSPDVNHFQVKKRFKGRALKQFVFNYVFRIFNPENQMLLNVEELASLFHFPISTTATPKIKWLKAGMAAPPVNIPAEGLMLGYNEYRGQKTDIRLTDSDRRRHMYVIGQTGVGKSNFLQEMAKKDAVAGKGFCFIDPHGDAIEDILASIPKERAEDVIVFDPSDVERPFGLNMLEFDPKHPEQKTFVINEMIGIFDQLYDLKATGGPMFEQYMRNAMLLIMEHPESGSTLLEISRVLADPEFRKFKLSKCQNPVVYDFWTKEAEKAGGEAALANMVPYITSKLTTFISNDMMRPIVTQQKSTIDFRGIMDDGKILLINLSKGKIGEINARLLGMVVVGKILMAALSRVDIPEGERRDFYLYLDEFQNVTTNSIAQILSEARKYHLVLILAHQFIGQLKEEISKAVFGNVGSLCAFRVGPEDAEFLEKQFAPVFTAKDIVNVDNYNFFARLLMNNELTKPFNMRTYPPTAGDPSLSQAYKALSRLRYGRDAEVVNHEIMERTRIA